MSKKHRTTVYDRETMHNNNVDSNYSYIVYTDGSCASNPGGPGGYGAIIIDTGTGEYSEYSDGYYSTTNNRMELMAAIVALEHIPSGESALLYADSQYVIGFLKGEFSGNKNLDLLQRLQKAMKKKRVKTRWVRGHTGNELNERCDTLALEASSSPTMEDDGYRGPASMRTSGGAMAVKIHVPETVELYYPHPEKHKVRDKCTSQISRLNKQKKYRFRDFLELKTGCSDGWSRSNVYKEFSEEVIDVVQNYFSSEDEVKACLRWYGRGLALDLAIRKELVTQEISENILHDGYAGCKNLMKARL